MNPIPSSALVCVVQTLSGVYENVFGRENEDAYLCVPTDLAVIPPKGLLVAMLDGISSGGYGAVAAREARGAIQVYWSKVPDDELSSDPLEVVYQLMLVAQNAVLDTIQGGCGGTTCLLVLIRGGLLTFGHVGDCQLLHRRLPTGFDPLTQDQTALLRTQHGRDLKRLVDVDAPITEQQMASYAQLENTLTRYLGKLDLPPDSHQWVETGQAQLCQGDLLLLCTDGLLKAFSLADLDRKLSSASEELVVDLFAWIEQNYPHDRDDTTLCLIQVCAPLPPAGPLKPYLPTFPALLGEEEGDTPVRQSVYATITDDIPAPLHHTDSAISDGPSIPDPLLGALIAGLPPKSEHNNLSHRLPPDSRSQRLHRYVSNSLNWVVVIILLLFALLFVMLLRSQP